MTDTRTELVRKRDRLDAELADIDAALDNMLARTDAMEDAIATAVTVRETVTEAFLPDDRLPETVTDETRGAVASYLDTLGEVRDVRSEKVERKVDQLKAETKNATDARDDIDEARVVIDRISGRADEAESKLDDAREELDGARSRFADDLAVLVPRFETFDIELSQETLGEAIEERVPTRRSEMQASVESVRERVADLSARKSTLEAEREKVQSIDGGGTCPTCNQNVGADRNESELEAIEEELIEIERRMGSAKQERDELIAGIEDLEALREQAIQLRSFRSETIAEAAGVLEDREENFADIRADLTEARTELALAKAERDRADATITTLEIELTGLEAEIDRLRAKSDEGENCLEAFDVVDDLEKQREQLATERSTRQAERDETKAERASIETEIEALGDE